MPKHFWGRVVITQDILKRSEMRCLERQLIKNWFNAETKLNALFEKTGAYF